MTEHLYLITQQAYALGVLWKHNGHRWVLAVPPARKEAQPRQKRRWPRRQG